MSNGTQRARLFVAAVIAFVGGLILASGLNWTKLGFAQSRTNSAIVQPIAEASNAFVAIANNVTPAVVSIEVFSAPRGAEDFDRDYRWRRERKSRSLNSRQRKTSGAG